MKTLKFLFTICLLIVGGQVFAQNTGLKPYENSTHTYSITKGTVGTSTLAWSISPGEEGTDWSIVSGAGTKDIKIQWLKSNTYTLQVTETRTDYTPGCPTKREIEVIVGTNGFDVIAELNTPLDATACANVDPSVVVDVDADGSNSNDVFGTTKRVFKVSSTGLAATVKWEFNYAITHVLDAGLGDYSVTVDPTNVVDVAASPIVVKAGATDVLITVSYTTNDKRQDDDFVLLLTLTDAQDETGTPEKDSVTPVNNSISYSVKALPATTGIIAD